MLIRADSTVTKGQGRRQTSNIHAQGVLLNNSFKNCKDVIAVIIPGLQGNKLSLNVVKTQAMMVGSYKNVNKVVVQPALLPVFHVGGTDIDLEGIEGVLTCCQTGTWVPKPQKKKRKRKRKGGSGTFSSFFSFLIAKYNFVIKGCSMSVRKKEGKSSSMHLINLFIGIN